MRTLAVGVPAIDWAESHSLPLRCDQCPRCGVDRAADIPFATNEFRGLVSAEHGCGEEYRLRIFRPVGDEIARWKIKGRQA